MEHFVEQLDGDLKGATRTVGVNKRVLDVDVGIKAELENEGVEVMVVVVEF